MNAIPLTDLEGEGREKALIRVLYSLKGQAVPAVNLMEAIGMEFSIQRDQVGKWVVLPQIAYVEIYWLMKRAEMFFRGHGFNLHYCGDPLRDVVVVPRRH